MHRNAGTVAHTLQHSKTNFPRIKQINQFVVEAKSRAESGEHLQKIDKGQKLQERKQVSMRDLVKHHQNSQHTPVEYIFKEG